jgi:hypothetical protein
LNEPVRSIHTADRVRLWSQTVLLSALLASSASADRVHLKGGAVLDGKVSEAGDKVVVQVESGTLSFRADEIERIDRGPSQLERFEDQLAKVRPGDVAALLKLADFCRDRELRAREREVLRKVIETEPDHAEARARLGYVRSEAGWVTRDEQRRNEGLVQYQGQWVTRAQKLELERLEAETKTARLQRDKVELELRVREVELEAKKTEAERPARHESARDTAEVNYVPFGYGPYFMPAAPCPRGACVAPARKPPGAPFINGARHPSDTGFSLPGVRDPKSYFE